MLVALPIKQMYLRRSAQVFCGLVGLATWIAILDLVAQDDMGPVPYNSGPTLHQHQPAEQPRTHSNIISAAASRVKRLTAKAYEELKEWAGEQVLDQYTQGSNHLNWQIMTGKDYADLPAETKFDNDALQAPFNAEPLQDDFISTLDDFTSNNEPLTKT